LHIGQWDTDFRFLLSLGIDIFQALTYNFSLEILKDWIDLIDDEGWIAREQILGEEARSKVPCLIRILGRR